MDRQLLERMVGAGVVILALVVVAPVILDGQRDDTRVTRRVSLPAEGQPLRTHTVRLDVPPERATAAPDPAPSPAAGGAARAGATAKPGGLAQPRTGGTAAALAEKTIPTQAPQRATQVAAEKPGWVVQLGSFAKRDNAEQLVVRLKKQGFPGYLTALERPAGTLFRVRVGPRDSRPGADELATALRRSGFKGQVMRQVVD